MTRNRFEDRVQAALGDGWSYEPLKLSYTISYTYTPDFVRGTEIVEAKGYWDAADRKKIKAVKAQNPDYTITIVFQNPNLKISKKSKTTYADWCDRHGIAWRHLS